MKHVYLTKEEIDLSYMKGAITVREVSELLANLNERVKSAAKKNEVERHARTKPHHLV